MFKYSDKKYFLFFLGLFIVVALGVLVYRNELFSKKLLQKNESQQKEGKSEYEKQVLEDNAQFIQAVAASPEEQKIVKQKIVIFTSVHSGRQGAGGYLHAAVMEGADLIPLKAKITSELIFRLTKNNEWKKQCEMVGGPLRAPFASFAAGKLNVYSGGLTGSPWWVSDGKLMVDLLVLISNKIVKVENVPADLSCGAIYTD